MEYLELQFTVPDESREALANRLMELGSTGMIEQEGGFTAYFSNVPDVELLWREISGFRDKLRDSGLDPDFSFSHEVLPDRDWNESWKASFIPIDVGERFTIIPSWVKHDTNRTPIIVDPGMVFGTGHHETTRRCLELIGELAEDNPKERFLDVGTGSGILAIAASRMGFAYVEAVDVDPLSVDAAKRNAEANWLQNIRVMLGTIESVEGSFNLIAANLISEILIPIAPQIVSHLAPEGRAILSGMLQDQAEAVVLAMQEAGLTIEKTLIDGQWVTLVVKTSGQAIP